MSVGCAGLAYDNVEIRWRDHTLFQSQWMTRHSDGRNQAFVRLSSRFFPRLILGTVLNAQLSAIMEDAAIWSLQDCDESRHTLRPEELKTIGVTRQWLDTFYSQKQGRSDCRTSPVQKHKHKQARKQ